jgi:WD40 repeat protein
LFSPPPPPPAAAAHFYTVQTVTTLAFDRTGSRLLTGSNDYTVEMYDFGGMNSAHRPFKVFTPRDGHVVLAISFSPTSDRFVVATGSAQPVVGDFPRV